MVNSNANFLVLTIVYFSLHFAHADSFKIVANKQIGQTQISKKLLKSLFLGDSVFLNEKRVFLIYINKDLAFETFVNQVIGMQADVFHQYWRRRLFSGKAIPPRKVDNSENLFEYMFSDVGVIGIISSDTILPNANNLKILNLVE